MPCLPGQPLLNSGRGYCRSWLFLSVPARVLLELEVNWVSPIYRLECTRSSFSALFHILMAKLCLNLYLFHRTRGGLGKLLDVHVSSSFLLQISAACQGLCIVSSCLQVWRRDAFRTCAPGAHQGEDHSNGWLLAYTRYASNNRMTPNFHAYASRSPWDLLGRLWRRGLPCLVWSEWCSLLF